MENQLELNIKSKEFANALSYVQENLVATKDENNEFGGFNYRNAEVILSKVKPLLREKNLVHFISDGIIFREDGETYIEANVVVTDGESSIVGKGYARETKERKKMNPPQLSGSASSYARKYALQGVFGIDDEKRDPDHPSNHPDATTKKKPNKKKTSTKKKATKTTTKKTKDVKADETLQQIQNFDNEVDLINWWKEQELDKEYDQAVRDRLEEL